MANTLSDFVDDEDIVGFVNDIKTADATNRAQLRTARGIDALFRQAMKRNFTTSNVSELIDVQKEISWHGEVQRPVAILRLKEFPLTSFTSLEMISSFDTNGDPDDTTIMEKNEYQVDLIGGLVKLVGLVPNSDVQIQIFGANSGWSFPAGVASMRAIYVAGVATVDVPEDIKLAWLIEFSKYWTMRRSDKWAEESVEAGEVGGVLRLVRAKFAPETVDILKAQGRRAMLSAAGVY